MSDHTTSGHISIERLKELSEHNAAPDNAEGEHLSSCEHCQHIRDFFSEDYIGRRLLKDADGKLEDFDKPA